MIKELLSFEILNFSNDSITVSNIASMLALATASVAILWIVKRILNCYKIFNAVQIFTGYTIVKKFLIVFYISAALKLFGIDVTVLIAGSAVLPVIIGLGLKAIFYDFISGIILLTEGTIKVGYVIQSEDKQVEILAIRFRTLVVKIREEKEIIVPNSFLTKNEIINWSNQKK
ncbi:MAG: mechanosensitive ion channel domain-containing protein [Saprospiraceae bacterium]